MVTKNKSKRVRLNEALSKIAIDPDVLGEIETLSEEFSSWAENMPEGMQSSDKHSQVQETAEVLSELAEMLDELTGKISEAESLEW